MTIFSFLKQNADIWDDKHKKLGWGIKHEKRAQLLYSTLITALVIISMVICML